MAAAGQELAAALPSLIPENVRVALEQTARATPAGAFVEVGVYQGGSAQHLLRAARDQGRELWLFDTFTGIPFKGPHDYHAVGDFSDVDMPALGRALRGAHFVKGVFPGTFTPELAREIGPLAFVHADCDQYDSVRACVEHLVPRLVKNGVIWFDDVACLASADKAIVDTLGMDQLQKREGKFFYVAS